MDSLEYQEWNERWKRVGIAATALGAVVMAWTALGQPMFATQSYHDQDVRSIERTLRVVFCTAEDFRLSDQAWTELGCAELELNRRAPPR